MTLDKINTTLFAGKMNQGQQQAIEAILSQCQAQGVTDARQVAYILATAYHECHNPRKPELRMTPMKGVGGEAYLKGK